jgi:hypothetical protein
VTDITPLLVEARKRLGTVDAYKGKVEGYARQDMLPVDLEHMMTNEAAELNMRAQAIERLSPTETVALQLRNRANELSRAGRTLRIDQTLNSKTPTEGYLDYLLEQRVVDIRKEGGLRDLGKRTDGRRDFLQEYEVRDVRGESPQTLWYAHFHYTSAKPAFNDFVKGHLKLPDATWACNGNRPRLAVGQTCKRSGAATSVNRWGSNTSPNSKHRKPL